MSPYLKFVQGIEQGVASAKKVSVSGKTETIKSNSKVILFSPHPDDECITGLLPLRLMREEGKQIINVPVTFGSDVSQQARRSKELSDACAWLGWDIHIGSENYQTLQVDDLVRVLTELKPEIVMMPHSRDWNSRHIATHFLVVEALEKMPVPFSCLVVETEFWGAMDDPNLMIEADARMVADLVAGTSLHAAEVARNPYHLLLPAWMQDNVRRGGELVGGQGVAAPDFSFATLYRLRKWQDGGFVPYLENGTVVPVGTDQLKGLF